MRHDIDSLEALQATLAWSDALQRARKWAIMVPFLALALPILLSCLELYRQIPAKAESAVVGPWMLPVKAEPPVVVGPWMLKAGSPNPVEL